MLTQVIREMILDSVQKNLKLKTNSWLSDHELSYTSFTSFSSGRGVYRLRRNGLEGSSLLKLSNFILTTIL